jgi:hypothetical protein
VRDALLGETLVRDALLGETLVRDALLGETLVRDTFLSHPDDDRTGGTYRGECGHAYTSFDGSTTPTLISS